MLTFFIHHLYTIDETDSLLITMENYRWSRQKYLVVADILVKPDLAAKFTQTYRENSWDLEIVSF